MNEISVKLEYGAEFKGELVKDVELQVVRTGALVGLDKHRTNGITYLKTRLAVSTKSIGGKGYSYNIPEQRRDIEAFWSAVSDDDLFLAARELVYMQWAGTGEGATMQMMCGNFMCREVSRHDVMIEEVTLERGKEPQHKYDLIEPYKLGDAEVSSVYITPCPVGHSEKIFQYYQNPNEYALRRLAGQVIPIGRSDLRFDYTDIEKLHPVDRKKMLALSEKFLTVNQVVERTCPKCGEKGKLVIDITAFF